MITNGSAGVEAAPWFVVWTESRAEKKVEVRLAALGLSPWLPTVVERHRWSDRWKDVARPLFPGYLFAHSAPSGWHEVLTTPGVLSVVKDQGKPALLTNEFVARLRDAIHSNAELEAVDRADYTPGDEVIVQEGVLRGVRGVVRELRNRRQLVIWVREIGRGVGLTIGSALVRPASVRGQ